jgi:hypothetical protein
MSGYSPSVMNGKQFPQQTDRGRILAGHLIVVAGIVVLILALLLKFGLPHILVAQTVSIHGCSGNLAQLDGALSQYALEKRVPEGRAIPVTNLAQYLGRVPGSIPSCPVGGIYPQELTTGQPASCSLMITNPALHEKLDVRQSGVYLTWPVRARLPDWLSGALSNLR